MFRQQTGSAAGEGRFISGGTALADGFGRGVGAAVFRLRENPTQEPMLLQALHQIVRVHDQLGDTGEHLIVGLNLGIQVAGDRGEVEQGIV